MAGGTFEQLNPAQLEAACHGIADASAGGWRAGPLLIVAGAGTGKTNTLAHRAAWLVLAGVHPARILLLTFTRRAAEDMTRRAQRIADAAVRQRSRGREAGRLVWAGTFHSIANRLLRQFARDIGLDPSFSVLDRGDSADLLDVLRHEHGLAAKEKRFPRKDTCLAIYSHRVNTQRPLEGTLRNEFPWCLQWHDDLTALYRAYTLRKQADRLLDFDDLLLYWHVLMGDEALARAVAAQFDHVLVDEYQDTNTLQSEIVLRLKPDGAGVTVVGDDAQSIYSFRAATVENILEFPGRFSPPAAIVTLEQNYRSSQHVLDAANALMEESTRQYRKTLRAVRAAGGRPLLVSTDDLRQEAEYVAARVLQHRETGIALKRQAVLFRSSHHSDLLEIELTRRGIPFVKYGGLRFLEAAHVKDLLAVLRWAENPRNSVAGFRVLQLLPGLGPASSHRCLEHLAAADFRLQSLAALPGPEAAGARWKDLTELLPRLADPSTPWQGQMRAVREWYEPLLEHLYESAVVRAADLEQLEQLSAQYPSRERFLTELALDPPSASGDHSGPPSLDEDYLILSTVHSAKGQEWEAVYLLNVTDGSFPSEFAGGRAEQIEEERRLLYVGMTRARTHLELLCPLRYHITQQPRNGDVHVYGARSRFLTDRVVAHFSKVSAAPPRPEDPRSTAGAVRIDAAARLRELW